MGFLPELKVDGVKMAQLTPMLVYLSKVSLRILNPGLLELLLGQKSLKIYFMRLTFN